MQKFKAYELTKKDGMSFAGHPRIGRFEDVCFIGSQVIVYPENIVYNYRFMKTDNYTTENVKSL